MFPVCPIMSQRKRHHDGHGNADAGLHFHLPAYVVPLETAALVESRKNTLQRRALIAALLPGGGVTRRRCEDATVPVGLDTRHAAVVGDLPAVLLVTLPITLAVQPVDRGRTAVLQGLSIFFESTELHLPLFFGLRTHTIHLTALVIHDAVGSNAVVEQARDGRLRVVVLILFFLSPHHFVVNQRTNLMFIIQGGLELQAFKAAVGSKQLAAFCQLRGFLEQLRQHGVSQAGDFGLRGRSI